ncbi:MAG: PilN domain-containing protein [Phycisphaerae bacterium]|nr:PilN domain-containing protein [Phycisphaerae bacterium]NUQ45564.1 PilN domain-containing protein [Phycisphaerae bacterium]
MNEIDFIPPAYHAAAARRRTCRAQAVWGLAMVVMMCVWSWSHHISEVRAAADLAAAREQRALVEGRKQFLDAQTVEHQMLSSRMSILESLDDAASWVVVLAEISALLPDGAVLTDVSVNAVVDSRAPTASPGAAKGSGAGTGAGAVTEAAEEDESTLPTLRLIGAAPSNLHISAFTAKLGGSPLFRDVQTSYVRDATFGDLKVRQFEVVCRVLRQTGGSK